MAAQPRRLTRCYLASGGPQQLLLFLQVLPLGCQSLLLCILLTPQVAGAEREGRDDTVRLMEEEEEEEGVRQRNKENEKEKNKGSEADGFLLSFTLQLVLAVLHLIVLLVQLLHTVLDLIQILIQFLDIKTQRFRQGGGGTCSNMSRSFQCHHSREVLLKMT